jgi:hypothetical protein
MKRPTTSQQVSAEIDQMAAPLWPELCRHVSVPIALSKPAPALRELDDESLEVVRRLAKVGLRVVCGNQIRLAEGE